MFQAGLAADIVSRMADQTGEVVDDLVEALERSRRNVRDLRADNARLERELAEARAGAAALMQAYAKDRAALVAHHGRCHADQYDRMRKLVGEQMAMAWGGRVQVQAQTEALFAIDPGHPLFAETGRHHPHGEPVLAMHAIYEQARVANLTRSGYPPAPEASRDGTASPAAA